MALESESEKAVAKNFPILKLGNSMLSQCEFIEVASIDFFIVVNKSFCGFIYHIMNIYL